MATRREAQQREDVEQVQTLLRDAGLRCTAARVEVVRCLSTVEAPVSHAELAELLARSQLDRVTVYRNLMDLTDAGLVRRTDLGDHVWRFELTRAESEDVRHPHFTCRACGTVECLPEVTVTVKPGPQRVPRALKRQEVEIHVRGVCDACA